MNQDEEHLRLLSIFHYVVGGRDVIIVALQAYQFGWDFLWPIVGPAYGMIVIMAWLTLGWGVLRIAAGHQLATRRRLGFCKIVAGLECLMAPLGTVLGVMTLIVLTRPPVARMFGSPGTAESSTDSETPLR